MGGQSRSSRYRWLWLWCGILTVAVVALAAVLTSSKLSSTNKDGSSIPENNTTSATAARVKSDGPPLSYIQLTLSHDDGHSWQTDADVFVSAPEPHSLILQNSSIHCRSEGIYFFYAYVTFYKILAEHQNMRKRTVTLYGNGIDKKERKLFEGVYSSEGEGSVSMAKIVRLQYGDSVRLNITNKYRTDPGNTYWGAYKI